MSLCVVCKKDSADHSKKLWNLHQSKQHCELCGKCAGKHSEKLWDMHTNALQKGQYCFEHHKVEKLYPMSTGRARETVGRVHDLNATPPTYMEIIPIYMYCTECNLAMGDIEVDYADVLDGLCLKCFREITDQTSSWYDFKSYEQCMKIRQRMKSKGVKIAKH